MALPTIVAIATPGPLHGISGKIWVTTGGGTPVHTAFPTQQIDVTLSCDDDDITHSEGGGWQVLLAGIKRGEFSITFSYDPENNALLAPYQMVPGLTGNLTVAVDGSVGPNNPTPAGAEAFTVEVLYGQFKFSTAPKAGPCNVVVSAKSTGVMAIPSA